MLKRTEHYSRIPRELPLFLFLAALCALQAATTRAFASADNLKVLGSEAPANATIQ